VVSKEIYIFALAEVGHNKKAIKKGGGPNG
jgi:hypothetical protein